MTKPSSPEKETKQNVLTNQNGAILIMVLFAGVLMAGVAYYVMQLEEGAEKEDLTRRFKGEVNLITNHINLILSNPKNCILSFKPSLSNTNADLHWRINPGPHIKISNNPENRLPQGVVAQYNEISPGVFDRTLDAADPAKEIRKYKIQPGVKLGNYDIQIVKYRLIDVVNSQTDTPYLYVYYKNKGLLKGDANNTEAAFYVKRIKMYTKWDWPTTGPVNMQNSGLKACRALSDDSNQIWSISSSNASNIFYGQYDEADPTTWEKVGVNNSTFPDPPSDVNLYVGGDVGMAEKMEATDDTLSPSFTYHSDRRLKKNIHDIENPLDVVMNLRGVEFDWIDREGHDFGFIAQEVEDYVPEIVSTYSRTGMKKVDYAKLLPFMIEVFQEQQKRIQKLKREIAKMTP